MNKILLIEDEKALHEALGGALKKNGHEVISAYNGEEGVAVLKQTVPDLIILDLMMPRMNGLDFLTFIKKEDNLKNIPVIVLTNSDNTEHIQQVLDAGATTYLVKSNYSLGEVVQKIESFLQK